ncbi:MAG: NFACT family protein [Sulfuricurvum sp.]|uniref:NFACT family protein n=1 Tax=Sulfuricurvum sp. TaxID=2025608 RepID=UPI00261E0005|nr:NFACT family protein [Sulfuricurvum sp.]MDD2369439.1 NFACT family protein [Sulfuricurvum sp.]MDD5117781.1 NFACT family protein [Sulfuricurvum sp.]
MRFSYLEQIAEYMVRYNHIVAAYRYDDTGIRLIFDRDNSWNFDMQRGNSTISIGEPANRGKVYQAPFDVLLAKRFNRSTIQSITLHNRDKIIRITVNTSGSYKSETTILQFEFTGKNTNVIILDKDDVVLEALRHIDKEVSTRCVRVGQVLAEMPKPPYEPQYYPLEDVREFLVEEFRRRSSDKLDRLKLEKIALLKKRLSTLQKHLDGLESESVLMEEAEKAQHSGHLVLANLDVIKPYEKTALINDFDGTAIHLELPLGCHSASGCAESFFKRSKKSKQKAIGLHQERSNLEAKIRHHELFIQTVMEASTPEEIALLFPSKTGGTKLKTSDSIAEFWIEGVKVSLGKSEKGNIELLRNAKARDIWMHLKDRPSAHVIISTDKQQLPERLLEAAAKLCVDFSVFEKGRYLVDYTPRREVKIQEGANVLYTDYKTLSVEKG